MCLQTNCCMNKSRQLGITRSFNSIAVMFIAMLVNCTMMYIPYCIPNASSQRLSWKIWESSLCHSLSCQKFLHFKALTMSVKLLSSWSHTAPFLGSMLSSTEEGVRCYMKLLSSACYQNDCEWTVYSIMRSVEGLYICTVTDLVLVSQTEPNSHNTAEQSHKSVTADLYLRK